MITGGKNLTQIVLNSFFIINVTYSQCRESNNCIHWCPDIVRHIGKKCTFGPVCIFCCMDCLRKCLIHVFIRGTIRHNQDIFLFPIYLTTHCNIMKPSFFPCFLMNTFKIPFLLLMKRKLLQIILLEIFRFFGM